MDMAQIREIYVDFVLGIAVGLEQHHLDTGNFYFELTGYDVGRGVK